MGNKVIIEHKALQQMDPDKPFASYASLSIEYFGKKFERPQKEKISFV